MRRTSTAGRLVASIRSVVPLAVSFAFLLVLLTCSRPRAESPRSVRSVSLTLYDQVMRQYEPVDSNTLDRMPFKKIVYWNEGIHFVWQHGLGVGRDAFRKAGCPVWQCEIGDPDPKVAIGDYDALLFDLYKWDADKLPRPQDRLPHQRYVLYHIEAPAWHLRGGVDMDRFYASMNGFFNWTMTYRWDSDVHMPYGWFAAATASSVNGSDEKVTTGQTTTNYAKGKTKLVAWFSSHCSSASNRETLVRQLARYVSVDVYGGCGNFTCGSPHYEGEKARNDASDEFCRRMAAANYKFYLAFENALCLDYITEKFFAMMRHNIVPVVIDAHGHHAKAAPPHSYINALDFATVRQLADYLQLLDKNDTMYNEYFEWKQHYVVRNSLIEDSYKRGFCRLCAALHDPSRSKTHKVYDNMRHWWVNQSFCHRLAFDTNRLQRHTN